MTGSSRSRSRLSDDEAANPRFAENTKVTSGDRIALPTLLSDEMVREFGYL